MLSGGIEQLAEMQDKLYALNRWSVLTVFQAMDAAGKDSAIKHVMSGINPQACQVYAFKAPSHEELDHDFLWRCMRTLPRSEEHTSELQSLMRISYAVFCLKKKKQNQL